MKLTMLKPRLQAHTMERRPTLMQPIGSTPRTRGRAWMEIRARVLRAHPLCVHCQQQGRVIAATEVDHITPLSMGGTDEESNLQALCHDCHAIKTTREFEGRAMDARW